MSARLAQLVAAAAPDGLQVNLWPTPDGYQANVKERAASGWTIASDPDPVEALLAALTRRATRQPDRPVVTARDAEGRQIDLEEAIAAKRTDALEDLGL